MEKSYFQPTAPATSDGASCYTDTDFQKLWASTCRNGVKRPDGTWLALNALPGTGSVQINTGGAVINGWHYTNDAVVTLPVPTYTSDSGFIVVLRLNTVAKTVRLTIVTNPNVATLPVAGANDLLLYSGVIKPSGQIYVAPGSPTVLGLTDQRTYTNCGAQTASDMLLTGTGTTVQQAIDQSGRLLWRQGGSPTSWGATGTTNYAIPTTDKIIEQIGTNSFVIPAGIYIQAFDAVFGQPYTQEPNVMVSASPLAIAVPPSTSIAFIAGVNLVGTNYVSVRITVSREQPYSGAAGPALVGIQWRAIGKVN